MIEDLEEVLRQDLRYLLDNNKEAALQRLAMRAAQSERAKPIVTIPLSSIGGSRKVLL